MLPLWALNLDLLRPDAVLSTRAVANPIDGQGVSSNNECCPYVGHPARLTRQLVKKVLVLIIFNNAYRTDTVDDSKVQPREVPLGIRQTLARKRVDRSLAVDTVAPFFELLVQLVLLLLLTNLAVDGVGVLVALWLFSSPVVVNRLSHPSKAHGKGLMPACLLM